VSVVIPVFNEVENLPLLYRDLRSVMDESGYSWEVIFVDDGSTDDSQNILRSLHRRDKRVCVLEFRRNFGQTAAMTAGFDHAHGQIVVTLDADLQNDPRDIPALLKKISDGFDVVSGWRVRRRDGFWLRTFPSRIANWLISRVTGTHLHDYGCTLKAYRANVLADLKLYGEMHRFIPALIGGNGARITEIPVIHHPRLRGQSKYGISRTIRVLLDLMTVKFLVSFLTKPLQIFGLIGFVFGSSGILICSYLALMRLFAGYSLSDRPLLLLGILLAIIGVQFVCMGIMAEIQIRTYHESSRKPIYSVREIWPSDRDVTAVKAIGFNKWNVVEKAELCVAEDKV
jgi:glycosyltransferase involved in cell wall biosynthesis